MPAGKRVEPHEAAIIRRYLGETSLLTQAIANNMPPFSRRVAIEVIFIDRVPIDPLALAYSRRLGC
jgi:hypothetical protein